MIKLCKYLFALTKLNIETLIHPKQRDLYQHDDDIDNDDKTMLTIITRYVSFHSFDWLNTTKAVKNVKLSKFTICIRTWL